MPWQEVSTVKLRKEFIVFATREDANISELCRRFRISRTTAYKWLRRVRKEGDASLEDRSRRPLRSPGRTAEHIEQCILEVRRQHPAWGARKIRSFLLREGMRMPAPSTVHAILHRNGCIARHAPGAPLGRFEHDTPNAQWQMDFKGKTRLGNGAWAHPLSILDDHSRFCVLLRACEGETHDIVKPLLEEAFRLYGLPHSIYADNGPPWASSMQGQWTRLGVWLLKLGVRLILGRPYHPQGRGKIERFHRSMKAEALSMRALQDIRQADAVLREWRHVYNFQRPHEALDMRTPSQLYQPSPRPFPEKLPEVSYEEGEIVRKVLSGKGYISFRGRLWRMPDAFRGELVAIRPTNVDGRYKICFGAFPIAEIDLSKAQENAT